jgi:hypothetical protein
MQPIASDCHRASDPTAPADGPAATSLLSDDDLLTTAEAARLLKIGESSTPRRKTPRRAGTRPGRSALYPTPFPKDQAR